MKLGIMILLGFLGTIVLWIKVGGPTLAKVLDKHFDKVLTKFFAKALDDSDSDQAKKLDMMTYTIMKSVDKHLQEISSYSTEEVHDAEGNVVGVQRNYAHMPPGFRALLTQMEQHFARTFNAQVGRLMKKYGLEPGADGAPAVNLGGDLGGFVNVITKGIEMVGKLKGKGGSGGNPYE